MKKVTFRLTKWLKIFALSLFSIISLLSVLIFFIIGTPSGTQWLLNTANSQIEGTLTYTKISGHLLGDFHIKELVYEDDAVHLKINNIILTWQPARLLDGLFYLEKLNFDEISFKQKSSAEDESDSTPENNSQEKFELSDIVLPIDVVINDVNLTDFQYTDNTGTQALFIEKLSLQADVTDSKVNLSHIGIKSPDFDISTDGWIVLKDKYPLQLNTDLRLHMSKFPALALHGPITGDLSNIEIKHSLTGDITGQIDISLQQVIAALTWDAKINIKQIPFHLLDPSLVENKELFDVMLNANGNLSAAQIQALQINLSKGEINLTGDAGWQPALNWDLKLNTENFDPAVFSPDLHGQINLQLESSGTESIISKTSTAENTNSDNIAGLQNKFKIFIALKKLQGTLMEQPLSGKGFIELDKHLLTIQQLQLASGQANVNIDGKADLQEASKAQQPLDLKWNINIPALEKLIPAMKGIVQGEGKLSGTLINPLLEGKLQIKHFSFENNKLNQAKLDFLLSIDENFSNHLLLSVDNIKVDANEIKNTRLTIKGPLKSHNIDLKSNVLGNQLKLGLKGNYINDEQSWQGTIEQLLVKGPIIGSWQQKQASSLLVNPQKVVLETFCLIDKQSSICTQGKWQPEKSQAELKISKLNLARIKSFLPNEINEFSGEVNLDSQINIQEALEANVDIEISPGVFSYRIDDGKTIRLKHKNGHVQVNYDKQKLTADLELNMDEHKIEANLAIPSAALESNPKTAPLKGHVKLNIKELNLIKAFVPEIQEMEGHINADIALSGVIADPAFTGIVEFISKKITVPVIGGEFTKIDIKLNAGANKQIDIKGKVHSGQGDLYLNGNLLMDADKNWPASLTIKGDKFELMHLPDMQALISPDFKLSHNKDGIKIFGQVTIPEAGIYLTDLPVSSRSVSDDTVIVGLKKKEPKSADMNLDMTVIMGNNVHIKAFGLDTRLKGQMRIKQNPGKLMTANGELMTVDGTFRAYGQDLTIEQGRISYAGGYLDNPGVNIKAGKIVDETTVGVMASGTAKELEFGTYSSDPALDSKDITSMLLTGQKFDADAGARLYAGKEITEELDVGVNLGGGDEGSEFVVRYKLRKNMHLEGTSNSESSGGSLMYTIEFE